MKALVILMLVLLLCGLFLSCSTDPPDAQITPTPSPSPAPPADTTIEGDAIGLYSDSLDWISPGVGTFPQILLYFQSGGEGGNKIYKGDDYNPEGPNIWYNRLYATERAEGANAIWYRKPKQGENHPTLDANNVSTRRLWRTFTATDGAPFDISEYKDGYFNIWIRSLDGFTGYIELTLGWWNPEIHDTVKNTGDDGETQTLSFSQEITNSNWTILCIPLSDFDKVDFQYFAKYEIVLPDRADSHSFLIDNICISKNTPSDLGASGNPCTKIEEGEDSLEFSSSYNINVDETETYQTIDGIGFCNDTDYKDTLINDLGATLIRVPIPADDDGTGWEPENDDDDPASFVNSLNGYRKTEVDQQINWMKEILAINPAVRFFACAWSPPGWIKESGLVREGSDPENINTIKDSEFDEYGEYLASYSLYLHQNGVPLHGLSMGNEVHFNHDFASVYIVGEDMITTIKEVGAALDLAESADENFTAPLITADDNVLGGRLPEFKTLIDNIKADPVAASYFDVISYHSYGENASDAENVNLTTLYGLRDYMDNHLGTESKLWMTETSGFYNSLENVKLNDENKNGALTLAEGIYTTFAYGSANAYVYFNADENALVGGCGLSWPGEILKHYARFIRPGAVRFKAEISENEENILVLGFKNPAESDIGESYTFIIINTLSATVGIDISQFPTLGSHAYQEYRSSTYHDCDYIGEVNTASSFAAPARSITTLYCGPQISALESR